MTDRRVASRAVALVARLGVDGALSEAQRQASAAFLGDDPREILHWQEVEEAIALGSATKEGVSR